MTVTVRDLNHIPVAYGRDAQTDCRGINDVDSGANIASDGDHDDVGQHAAGGYLSDMNVTSHPWAPRSAVWAGTRWPLRTWTTLAVRLAAPANTSGTRGADDIGSVPA